MTFGVADAQRSTLNPFKIKDQFDAEYMRTDFIGQICVWIGSDKDGSEYNEIWGNALKDSLLGDPGGESVRFVGISDLRGVPSFMKGFVRGKFPKEKDNRVLMDWKGVFAEQYEWQEGACNILVFSAEGVLVHQTAAKRMDNAKRRTIEKHVKLLTSVDLNRENMATETSH